MWPKGFPFGHFFHSVLRCCVPLGIIYKTTFFNHFFVLNTGEGEYYCYTIIGSLLLPACVA